MIKRDMQKFIKTGNVNDYLEYKKKQNSEISKEIAPGEKNESKRRNHSKGGEISGKS